MVVSWNLFTIWNLKIFTLCYMNIQLLLWRDLGNTSSLSYTDLPKDDMSILLKTSHLLISSPISSPQKSQVLSSCEAHSGRTKFSKILIFSWKLIFYWKKILILPILSLWWQVCLLNMQVYQTINLSVSHRLK